MDGFAANALIPAVLRVGFASVVDARCFDEEAASNGRGPKTEHVGLGDAEERAQLGAVAVVQTKEGTLLVLVEAFEFLSDVLLHDFVASLHDVGRHDEERLLSHDACAFGDVLCCDDAGALVGDWDDAVKSLLVVGRHCVCLVSKRLWSGAW